MIADSYSIEVVTSLAAAWLFVRKCTSRRKELAAACVAITKPHNGDVVLHEPNLLRHWETGLPQCGWIGGLLAVLLQIPLTW